jgi:hypothetical protein
MAGKTKPTNPLMINEQSWDKAKVMDILCAAIASSSSSIATILASGHEGNTLPGYSTVAVWMAKDDALREQYTRAKEAQAEHMAEEVVDIADAGTNDWMEANDPDNPGYRANGEHIQRSRLRIETRKWLMGKLKPKKYGDSTRLEHTGKMTLEQLITGSNDGTERD